MNKSVNGKEIKMSAKQVSERENEISKYVSDRKLAQWLHNRQAAYAQLNQDEMRYDDLINGTTIWQDTITAIKAKYPKPL